MWRHMLLRCLIWQVATNCEFIWLQEISVSDILTVTFVRINISFFFDFNTKNKLVIRLSLSNSTQKLAPQNIPNFGFLLNLSSSQTEKPIYTKSFVWWVQHIYNLHKKIQIFISKHSWDIVITKTVL